MKEPRIHDRDLIAGLQKGLALMQLFNEQRPRLSVPLAARLSGMTPSATRRFLLTLVHEGFAETDGRHYWLTARALRIGQAYVDSAQLPRMLRPIVEQVARNTGEHVSVGVRDGDDIVHIVRSRYSHIASMSIRPGSLVPLYCTASGRLWLASLDQQAQADYFARTDLVQLTPHTITDPDAVRKRLREIAEQGFALVDQEFEVGMRVIAVPLYDRAGVLRATLSLTTHASRVSLEEMRLRYLMPLFEAQALLKPVMG
ncbi:IclR family transcriptional regulator domain-containing protein [Stutzerimonas tarimensis]|uniref:IclR family transcriptional regulator C-terminal domain-containing protein n=1 Tax=Stutzerimonas tarimensis TaxID=1507735 RepID=A0ABV7T4D0_9GAMM